MDSNKIDGRIGNGPRMDPLSGLSDNGVDPTFVLFKESLGEIITDMA